MKQSMFQDVKDVMTHHGVPLADVPTLPTSQELYFRIEFIDEEVQELHQAFLKESIVDMADAIADLTIVVMGLAVSMGLPLEAICKEVNMANLQGKEMVSNINFSKRHYEFDLHKLPTFVSPEPAIARLLFGDDHV
jgi:predicted HAD superfamily Cof-like phosphohydrolase